MSGRTRLIAAGVAGAGLLAFLHPSADLTVLAHRGGDPAPRRVEAKLDTGLVAFRFLVTWTADRLAR